MLLPDLFKLYDPDWSSVHRAADDGVKGAIPMIFTNKREFTGDEEYDSASEHAAFVAREEAFCSLTI